MNIKELQENWDKFGKTAPLWVILTNPEKKGGKRVTQALCRSFDQCCGIDVAPAMIELAEQARQTTQLIDLANERCL